MISHDTRMRDWINIAISSRSSSIMRGMRPTPSRPKDLKDRLDELEQARQLKELIGQDPY